MGLKIGEGLLRETFATLRGCGAGRRECVVYWTGTRSDPTTATAILHPDHRSQPNFYEIDQAWLHRASVTLAREGRSIRAQVHTHGREAFHSETDDGYPAVQTPGFLSLVVPWFASGPISLDGAYLARLGAHGAFEEIVPSEGIEVIA